MTRIDSTVLDGSEPIVKQGPGRLVLSAANLHTGGTIVEQGTLVVRNLAALGSGGVQVRAGATLVLDGGVGTFAISSLALDPGGRIDVGTSKLEIAAGLSRGDLLAALRAAQGDGSWNGTSGIGSSVVQKMGVEGTQRTLGWVGWVANDDSSVLVGFAAPGDTDLSGSVNVLDVANMLEGMSGNPDAPVAWSTGDFNHDDTIDVMDLADLFGGGVLDADTYLPAPPPATPRNLQALPLSTTSITLSWATDDTPAGYEIERSADGITDWQPLASETIQIAGTSATISGFEPGERASFRVRAFAESPSWWWDDRYRSADTAAVAATAIPSAPRNVTSRGVTPTQAVISWVPGPGCSTGMRVERQTLGADAWVEVGDVAADRRFVIDATAAPGETYAYRVQAVSGTAVSAAASPPGFVTLPSVDPPDDADEDGDGVPDFVEVELQINPDAADTDGDGVSDYVELQQGSDPAQPGVLVPAEPSRANAPLWLGEAYFDTTRDRRVLLLPAEIPLPAPILVNWYSRTFSVNGTMLGNRNDHGWSHGTEVLSTATRWITVDKTDKHDWQHGMVVLQNLAIDVDIDGDNNNHDGFPKRSEWEETLEEEEYGLGRLIMLDKPDRPLTPVLIQLPLRLPSPLGLPPDDELFRVRLDWNQAGDAGTVKLWTSRVMADLRRPESAAAGGHQILPGETYTLEDIGYDHATGQIIVYAEGVKENAALKTLAGVEREGKPEEYIRGTFIAKGQEVGSDKVKYLVANEDSFFYQLQTRQEVRNALASRGVYTFADLKSFCLQPQAPAGIDLGDGEEFPLSPNVSGFKAMVYQDYITGERQYVLAFGGTDDNNPFTDGDWVNNVKQALGRQAPQYAEAMKIAKDLAKDSNIPKGQLVVTGHSLGGGLASAAAVVAGAPADTFNASWLHPGTLLTSVDNGTPLRVVSIYPLLCGYEIYPGALANLANARDTIDAYFVDYDILTRVQQAAFVSLDWVLIAPVGSMTKLDSPYDVSMVVAGLPSFGTVAADIMLTCHKMSVVLYGLLVKEGAPTVDMLGYSLDDLRR